MAGSLFEVDLFKEKFKYYKAKKFPPSLQEVIRLESSHEKISVEHVPMKIDERNELLGLRDLKNWQLLSLNNHPGLMCIKNPFTALGQRYWITKCLKDYPKKPNKSNIDIEFNLSDWWNNCSKENVVDRTLQKKMRWITLGYHHNWDSKVYSEELRGPFPEELAELCDVIANYVGYPNFRSQAAIINYYHMDSTLSPHTDHSEKNLNAPLFSFSFGQSALFLIGGTEKNTTPSAILLESGDIVIMSKEARLCYHAVPKILPAAEASWNMLAMTDKEGENILEKQYDLKYITDPKALQLSMFKNQENDEWHNFNSYISDSRININVRQVLNDTQNYL